MTRVFSTFLIVALLAFMVGGWFVPQAFAVGPPPGDAHPPIHVRREATASPSGLFPVTVWHAYGFDQLQCARTGYPWGDPHLCGFGQVIAVVDAFDSPTVFDDLEVFSRQFDLPPLSSCIVGDCFVKVAPQGQPRVDQGWALEIALDVQWSHAIAPGAKIVLVEAISNSLSDLLGAVDYGASWPGVHQVSMSWGGLEFTFESLYDFYFQHPGVSYFASSGDSGNGVIWPAVSPYVVGVGGTTLNVDGLGNVLSEVAWSGSGGGMSKYVAEPQYQVNYGIQSRGKRGVPDVSYDADPSTGFPVYDTTPYNGQTGWFQVGGTSAGAPQWAALFAIANSGRGSPISSAGYGTHMILYAAATGAAYSSNYRDIVSGSNGKCGRTCRATNGYDFVTGLGSPLANTLVGYIQTH